MNEIIQSLSSLGLTEKESKIYISLLKLGEASVGDIADGAAIKRPTAYVILDELRKKGMVLKTPHAKKTLFTVKSPDELHKRVIDNIVQFEKVLPRMRAINPKGKAVKTLYFEGIEGVKEALYYRMGELEDETISGFWARNNRVDAKMLVLFDKWGKENEKKHNVFTGITPDHESIRELKKKNPKIYEQITLVPENDYSSDISIDIVKDFVRIIDPHELKGVIIENKRVVDAMRQIYNIVEKSYKKN